MEKTKRLKNSAEVEFTEKKSVFIGFSTTVKNEEEALSVIRERKKMFQDATHNVYAYITDNGNIARYSDDNEPQGTAGMPVLNAIRMSGISDVLVVVTRYFGGILLGAGGLVRAYSKTATMALEAGGISVYEEFSDFELICSYSDYQKVSTILSNIDAKIENTSFADRVEIDFSIPSDVKDEFILKIEETFAGKLTPKIKGTHTDSR